ncbi:MAG: hypothetical protein JSV91_15010 [Phycisphaerales bacterium]|nr:MAG: hypothetical protein JSV91_15010 [Phycisphaerales bacterium]
MRSRPLPAIAFLAAGLTILGSAAYPANAQSDNDLRRENQSLRTRVRDLEAELRAAREQIEALQKEIGRLEGLLEAAGSGRRVPLQPPPEPEKVTVDESVPEASPRALFTALTNDYQEKLGDLERGDPGSTTRANYFRALERWQNAATAKFRAPIEWHVRVKDRAVPTARGGFIISLVAVDPVTDVELGQSFEVLLARNIARRLADVEDRGGLEVLLLKGILMPAVWINPNRESPGTFDNPRLIGPFAEFDFRVEVRSLIPAPKEKEAKDKGKEQTGDEQTGQGEGPASQLGGG